MALVSAGRVPLWNHGPIMGSYAAQLLDAGDEKAAYIFQAPKTGTIDRVCFRTGTVTTGATVDVRLETVAADGTPSGTLAGTNTNAAQVIADANDNVWFEVTLTAGASVTQGDYLAIVVVNPSVSPGNLNIVKGASGDVRFPYTGLYTGSWTLAFSAPIGAVRYSDTTYPEIFGAAPWSTIAAQTFNTGSTPDERGNLITVPFACKVAGLWLDRNSGTGSTGDFTLKLYNTSDTVLESVAVTEDTQGAGQFRLLFDTEVTLTAGQQVRVTELPTSATNCFAAEYTNPTGMASAGPGGTNVVYTARTDAGSWTETSNKRMGIGLILSALDDGAGGGSSSFAYGFAG